MAGRFSPYQTGDPDQYEKLLDAGLQPDNESFLRLGTSLVDCVVVHTFRVDHDGNITSVNDTWVRPATIARVTCIDSAAPGIYQAVCTDGYTFACTEETAFAAFRNAA